MKTRTIRAASLLFVLTLLIPGVSIAKVKPKATVAKKKLTIFVGKSKGITIRNKQKGAKYTYQASKKNIVTISYAGKAKALKKGTVNITVRESSKKKNRKVGVVSVTCKKNPTDPVSTPTLPPSPTPSQAPTPTPVPTSTPKPPVGPAGFEVPGDFDTKQSSVTYGTVEKKQYYSTTTEKTRKVNIILPAGYSKDKQYPVLYLLHGIGGDENEWLNQGKPNYILSNLAAKGLAKEMIVVIPNCRARANDAATTEFSLDHYAAFDNFINDLRDNLMPYIKENYSIATGRENTAIAGLSMGGRESLNIGLHMPETFGYIAAFSPGYGVFAYTANGVSEKGLFTEETFRLPDAYKDNTLLLINNGISEGGENAIGGTCHKVLEKNGIPHLFYVTTGGHDFRVWKHGLYNFAVRIFQ